MTESEAAVLPTPKCPPDSICFQCNPPQWLQTLRADIPECPERFRMASPCVGLDAGYRASKALCVPYKPACVYDKELGLLEGLKDLYPFDPKDVDADVHLGFQSGDITRFEVATIFAEGKKVDGLFSGQPLMRR